MVEDMAQDGHSAEEIVAAFQAHMKCKVQGFYRYKSFESLRRILEANNDFKNVGSKAEMIFYEMLINHGIKFDFQAEVGPYRIDYLIAGFLVVELDGPLHNQARDDRRDKYLKKMGYTIVRVPSWVLIMDCGAVIDEIKNQLSLKGK